MIAAAIQRTVALALPRLFAAQHAGDLRAELELRVRLLRHRPTVPVAVQIADGRCAAIAGAASHPGAVATVGLHDLLRLATGRAGWPQLLSAGRLTMSGDPFLALRLPLLFRLPVRRAR